MSARRGAAYLHEEEETSPIPEGEWWLLGTFSALHDGGGRLAQVAGLGLDEAVAWARSRAPSVFVDVGGEGRRWIGDGPPPDDDVPDGRAWLEAGPPLRRRRHPAFAHLDRTDEDAPIDWSASVWVADALPAGHPDWPLPVTSELDDAVARLARACGADWDRRSRDGFLRDLDMAERAAAGEAFGWATHHRSEYRLRLTVTAPTHAAAVALAGRAVQPTADLAVRDVAVRPAGWVAPYDGDDEPER